MKQIKIKMNNNISFQGKKARKKIIKKIKGRTNFQET
jgi:hypothetical protein